MKFEDKKSQTFQLLVFTAVVAVIVAAVIAVTIHNVQKDAVDICYEKLSETSAALGDNIESMMISDTTMLNAVARIISRMDIEDREAMTHVLESYDYSKSMISHMEILYPDNQILVSDGALLDVTGRLNFDEEAKKGIHVSRKSAGIYNPEDFVVRNFVPIERDGETIAMLIGSISLSELPEIYKVRSYNGEASIYLLEIETGDFLLDTWHKSLGNLHDLGGRKLVIGKSIPETVEEMKLGRSGNLAFVSKTTGETLYMHYQPLQINGWCIIVTVPHSAAFSGVGKISTPLYIMAVAVAAILVAYMGCIIIYLRKSYREKKQQLRQIQYMYTIEQLLFDSHQNIACMGEALGEVAAILDSKGAFLLVIKNDKVSEVYHQTGVGEVEASFAQKLIGQEYLKLLPDGWKEADDEAYAILNGKEELSYVSEYPLERIMMVPVFNRDKQVTGILGVANSKNNYESPVLLQCVALSFASASSAIDSYRTIHRMGTEDTITGLKNRNSYEAYLKKQKNTELKDVACVYVDVNGLHEVNNRMGHENGDRLLQTVADIMREVFQPFEVYRIGGDEYVTICTGVSEEDAYKRAEQLQVETKKKNTSVSVGVVWKSVVSDFESIAMEADQKMLDAKRAYYSKNGVNRRSRT